MLLRPLLILAILGALALRDEGTLVALCGPLIQTDVRGVCKVSSTSPVLDDNGPEDPQLPDDAPPRMEFDFDWEAEELLVDKKLELAADTHALTFHYEIALAFSLIVQTTHHRLRI